MVAAVSSIAIMNGPLPYVHKYNVLSAWLNKTFPFFLGETWASGTMSAKWIPVGKCNIQSDLTVDNSY